MQTPGGSAPRSALLTAWGNAWLSGDVSLPELVERVRAADDTHEVVGLGSDSLPLGSAVGRLRAAGVTQLRLVLPVPGDVLGLPGPGPFTGAAIAACEGVLALRTDGSGSGLVPGLTAHASPFDGTVTTVLWKAYDVTVPGPHPGPFLHDAEHDLRRGVAECVQVLRDLDVGRWRPEIAGALQDLRAQGRRGLDDELPASYPPRARLLLVQARQLAGVLQLAGPDPGAAVSTTETLARERALHQLEHLVRRARVAAYNAYGLPS